MFNVKIFHHDDADGYTSAYLVSKALENVKSDSIEFIEMNYNKEFPFDRINKDSLVYIVDFSINPEDMIKLLRITTDVIWIDHHISAINKYNNWMDLIEESSGLDNIPGIRVNGLSASALCYLYFFGGWTENALQELRDTSKSEEELLEVLTNDFKEKAPKWIKLINCWDIWDLVPKDKQISVFDE